MPDLMTLLSKPEMRRIVIAAVWVASGAIVVSSVLLLIPDIVSDTWLTDPFLWKVIVSAFVILTGFTAYQAREMYRFWYALIEIGFGVIYGIWAACNVGIPIDMTPQQGLTLVGCVYIIVRGGANLKEATSERERDKRAHNAAESQ